MRRTATVTAICVLVLTGCDRQSSPTEPGRLPSAARPPRLEIGGATSIAPGATAQFRATATSASGVVLDVTRDAAWTSANPGILRSIGAGLFAAGPVRGETNLVAVYEAGTAVLHVLILEGGTFVVRGTVSDSGVGLPGAHIRITGGTGGDQVATTDPSGRFALYGVAGAITLSVTAPDYQPQAQTVDVTGDSTVNFNALVIGTRPDVNGVWRLTFSASPACTDLPEDARVRVYRILIRQTGPTVQATLTLTSSGWLLTDSVPITAQLFAQAMTFAFPVDTFDGPAVYERLAGGEGFTLEGNASARYGAGGFDGLIDGRVHIFDTTTFHGPECVQPDHRWRLER